MKQIVMEYKSNNWGLGEGKEFSNNKKMQTDALI
jgi:hypothetical protein